VQLRATAPASEFKHQVRQPLVGSKQSRLGERLDDSLYDTVDVREYLTVPEAQNTKTALLYQFRTPVIPGDLVQVLAPVELDHKFQFRACKVRDEVSDWKLPPETELLKSFRSKTAPQLPFRIRLIATQLTGAMMWKGNGFDASGHRRVSCGWW
jgi:hypothetical protein